MSHGGKRPGAGRKAISEELKTADLARKAIVERYGTLEAGLNHLLGSMEPALIKFVFEHAFGKSPDIIKGEVNHTIISIKRGNRTSAEPTSSGATGNSEQQEEV